MSVEERVRRQEERAPALAALVAGWLGPARTQERALDSGCGAGALAIALAPLVGEVVGVDASTELLQEARRLAPQNVTFVEGDVTALPFPDASFEVAGSMRVLHHVRRPELAISELVRVVRPGGRVLVVDQLGDVDPLVAMQVDRFERARDPSHARYVSDADMRGFLDANDLVLQRSEVVREQRELEPYLDLVGAEGEARERARALAPGERYWIDVGWYLAVRRGFAT